MVNSTQIIVKINDDKDVMIKLGINSCYLDNDCNYGKCELSNGNICSYYEESLIFGKGIEFIKDADYFDGFIGNIKINLCTAVHKAPVKVTLQYCCVVIAFQRVVRR